MPKKGVVGWITEIMQPWMSDALMHDGSRHSGKICAVSCSGSKHAGCLLGDVLSQVQLGDCFASYHSIELRIA
jgi:hypothetical protein